jgi:hypothetical protein
MVSNNISRFLNKHNITTIHIPVKKHSHMLRPVQDKLGLKVAGIHCVPCQCGKVYVEQTVRSIKTRCTEHMRYICLGQLEKFAVKEQQFEKGHNIDFSSISMDHTTKEVTDMKLHPSNFNGDSGFTLCWSWYPVMNMLEQYIHQSRRKTKLSKH